MDKEKYIVDKIISDANKAAKEYEKDTRDRLDLLLSHAEKEIEQEQLKTVEEHEMQKEFLVSQNKANTKLQIKKQDLIYKQQVVNNVFELALKEITQLKTKDYLNLIKKLIENNCSDNDEVVVCKKDEKIITESFIKSISTATKKNLKRVVSGDFENGIVLSNKYYDKVLTLNNLFAVLKDSLEKDVADILFRKV